jgi:hypothetical protein
VASLSMDALEGGSPTGEPEGYVEEASGDGHFSIGILLGNLESGSITRDFERWKRQVSLSVGYHWGTWGGRSVYWEC